MRSASSAGACCMSNQLMVYLDYANNQHSMVHDCLLDSSIPGSFAKMFTTPRSVKYAGNQKVDPLLCILAGIQAQCTKPLT